MNGQSTDEEYDQSADEFFATTAPVAPMSDSPLVDGSVLPPGFETFRATNGARGRDDETGSEWGGERHRPSGDPDRHDSGQGLHSEATWACLSCDGTNYVEKSIGAWSCRDCGSNRFYNVQHPTRHKVSTGTWVYVPDTGSSPPEMPPSFCGHEQQRPRRRRRRRGGRDPPHDSTDGPDEEQAESETFTNDPVIDTDGSYEKRGRTPDRRPSEPRHRGLPPRRSELPPPDPSEDRLLNVLKKLIKKDDEASDDKSWDSMKGPRKGVRFRGGAPPAAPQWRYQPSDVRAYEKYERKVKLWQLQVRHYMSSAEAGLALYASLGGEAEQQLEFLDMDKVYHRDGVQYVLDQLKQAFKQKEVYVKRHYLNDYENISRYPNESLRSFINRYKRVEASLKAIGIDMSLSYDAEARGSRLLDRAKLTADQQRMILVGTSQNMAFDMISAALTMQFPDYRAPPPLAQRDPPKGFGKQGKGYDRTSSAPSSSSSSSASTASHRKGDGRDGRDGKGRFARMNRVFQTILEECDDEAPDAIPEDGEADPGEAEADAEVTEQDIEAVEPDDGEEDGTFGDLAQVLTITAKKLAAMTQGRKFKNGPKKSIEQRKMESPCAACGQLGHWAGDDACPVSGKGSEGGKGSDKGSSSGGKGEGRSKGKTSGKKVFRVNHYTGFEQQEPLEYLDDGPDTENTPFHVWVVFGMGSSDVNPSLDYMILDTACQRTCCGSTWFYAFQNRMNEHGIPIHLKCQNEKFMFGAGSPLISHELALLPACIHGNLVRLAASILDTNIPLLGSLPLFRRLGLVVDLAQKRAFFSKLGCTVDLHLVLGHLAVKVTDFPPGVASHAFWDVPSVIHEVDVGPSLLKPSDQALRMCDIVRPEHHGQLRLHGGSDEGLGTDHQEAAPSQVLGVDSDGRGCQDGHHGSPDLSGDPGGRSGDEPPRAEEAHAQSAKGPTDTGTLSSASQRRPEHAGAQAHEAGEGDGRQLIDNDLSEHLPARQHHPLRQRSGQVRSMRRLQQPMALERSRQRLEVGWLLLQIIAAASASLSGQGICDGIPRVPAGGSKADYGIPGAGINSYGKGAPFDGATPTECQVKGAINDILGGWPWSDGGSSAGLRRSDGIAMDFQRGPIDLRVGQRKQLVAGMKKAAKQLVSEVNIMEHLDDAGGTIQAKIDLLEIFAGQAGATARAPKFGLSALQPFDLDDGYDISQRGVREWIEQACLQFQPLLLMMGFPCTEFCIFNENLNYSWRTDELAERRFKLRPTLEWAVGMCKKQASNGLFYFFENPVRSRVWEEKSVRSLEALADNIKVECHAGAFGATDVDGNPICKPYGIYTNSKELAERLARRLTPEEKAVCKPLEAKHVTNSQVYPLRMVDAVLRGLQAEAHKRSHNRFDLVHSVFFAQPLADETRWGEALLETEKTFGTSASKAVTIPKNHTVYKMVSRLVPWELTRVQLAKAPAAKRLPTDLGYSHRGWALRYSDGTLEVESEDLGTIEYPKQKFSRPVAFAIFFYGYAEDDKTEKPVPQLPGDIVPGLRTDITFPDLPAGVPREVQASVARLHVNAGHPSRQELTRLFVAHGVLTPHVLSCLQHLSCGTCKRTQNPQHPRPAAIPVMTGQFGDRLQADRFWVRDLMGKNHCFLGMVDMATNYQQAIRLTDFHSADVLEAFRVAWFRPFGYPLVLEVDDDKCFAGQMKETVEGFGVHLIVVPAEAHWRIGTIERRNAVLRQIAERLIDERACADGASLDDVMVASTQAVNSSVATKGRTPYQAVFGRLPRFPGDLLGDERALLANYDATLAEELRSSAIRVIAETRASHTIRRALLRKTATSREEAQKILPGSLAAYWRWQKKARGRKRGGYVLARLLNHDVDGKTAWLHNGNSVVQVTYEQLRPAFGLESWTPSSQDILILKDGATKIQHGLWEDERGPGPDAREPLDVQVQEEAREELILPLAVPPPATPAPAPATPAMPELSRTAAPEPTITFSPSYRQQNYIYQRFNAPPPTLAPETTTAPAVNEDELRQQLAPDVPVPEESMLPGEATEETAMVTNGPETPEELPPVPEGIPRIDTGEARAKLPRLDDQVVLMAWSEQGTLAEAALIPPDWDGRPLTETGASEKCDFFRVMASQVTNEPPSSDSSDDEKGTGSSVNAHLSRQERKAMDREVPWREIMKLDAATIEAYIQANIKEYKSWMEWNCIQPVDEATIKKIKSDPALRRRIIPSRNAYRDKNRGTPPLRAKCRTVVVGCQDPDIMELNRTSPTPSRVAEAVILQLASSGFNQRVNLRKKKWSLWAGDVSTAFLQGVPEARRLPLYMKAPRDGIQARAKTFEHELYLVTGNLYGFTNAPATWSRHVSNMLMQKLKLTRHKLDHMFFYGLDSANEIWVAVIVHVDDFLVTFREDYDMDAFKACFTWGSETLLTLETSITFRGKELSLVYDDLEKLYVIVVTQKTFIHEMASGRLPKGRLKAENQLLSGDEWKEYRSCAGSLQWLGGQSRPDVCSTVSLSNKGLETSAADLQTLYDCIDTVKASEDIGIRYYPVDFHKGMFLVGYGDSSWANAPGHKSQMGVVILVASSECLIRSCPGSILDWKSARSPRVTRSTLASEANAMDEAVDRAAYLNYFLTELLYPLGQKLQRRLRQLQVTDCRSLYDAVLSPNPVLTEKRTVITVRSIQEYVEGSDLRWTPTWAMWADGLTKPKAELLHEMREWLRRPRVTLVEDSVSNIKDTSVKVEHDPSLNPC